MIEAHVKISNSESKLAKKALIYDENIFLSKDDPKLQLIVDQALKDFERSGTPEEVILTLKMVW